MYNVQWLSTTAVGSPASVVCDTERLLNMRHNKEVCSRRHDTATIRAIDVVVVKCDLLGLLFLLLLLLPGKEHPQLHHL
jgi:hypothetical protein